jgi:hypothetical protein
MAGGVFICYRRDDSAGWARLIYDRLSSRLKSGQVFIDVDNIEPGLDFVKILSERVGDCDALVAVIGKSWLSRKRKRRRIDDPRDHVRIEIEAALTRDIPVIPVLVDGAIVPGEEALPDGLKPLSRRQAIEISNTRFDSDAERLTKTLVKRLAEVAEATRAKENRLPAAARRYYVSYAWGDENDLGRKERIEAFCEAAESRGDKIFRDKTAVAPGELISDFVRKIGEGDRIIVFLSDSYLRSPYCMYELYEIWRNNRQGKATFLNSVRFFTIDGARIREPEDRLKHTAFWLRQRDELQRAIDRVGWGDVGDETTKRYRLIQKFAGNISDVLALFADVVQPWTFEDFLKYGFDDPPGNRAGR